MVSNALAEAQGAGARGMLNLNTRNMHAPPYQVQSNRKHNGPLMDAGKMATESNYNGN